MAALTGAVVLIVFVLAIDLLVTLGLIRRLRHLQQRLPASSPDALPTVGSPIPSFAMRALDGEHLDETEFARGLALAVFLSAACEPCNRVRRELSERPPSQRTFVFVKEIPGLEDETKVFAESLDHVGTVAIIAQDDTLARRLEISIVPTLLAITDGTITAASTSLPRLFQSLEAGVLA